MLPVSGTLIRHTADAFLIAQGMALPSQLVEATDTSFVVGLLQRSEAVWFAPQGAVEGLLARGELKRVAIDTASTEGPVGLTVRRTIDAGDGSPGGAMGEGARLLIEEIRDIVRKRKP